MSLNLTPLRLAAVALAGWLSQQQQDVIDFLREENRVLRGQMDNRRLRLNDEQRRRLAERAQKLGHKVVGDLDRHSGHLADLASKANCSQVRR